MSSRNAQPNCSELAAVLTELASNISARHGIKTIDDMLAEMRKIEGLENLDRQTLANNIAEASTGHARVLSDVQKDFAALKREAKSDAKLRAKIDEFQSRLAGTLVPEKAGTRAARSKGTKAIEDLRTEAEHLRKRVERAEGTRDDLSQVAKDVAREVIREGEVSGRDDLVRKVHENLAEEFEGLTERDVQVALADYGDFTPLNKDPVEVELRHYRAQLQKVLQLEDWKAGRVPPATGKERPAPDQETRVLQKQIGEAKKQSTAEADNPERQLKTIFDTMRRRLTNQIKDYDEQIQSGKKHVKTKTDMPTKPDIEALEALRDEKRAEYKAIFGRPEMTDAQRLEAAKKATNKAIAELERRLSEGDFSKRDQKRAIPDAELTAARLRREALAKRYRDSNPNDPRVEAARKRLDEIEGHLQEGTMPESTDTDVLTRNQFVAEMQAYLEQAREELHNSPQAVKQRREKLLDSLETHLEKLQALTTVPPTKAEYTPLNKEIDRLDMEISRKRQAIRYTLEDMKPKGFWKKLAEPLNFQRTLVTAIDLPILRQGIWMAMTHPIRTAGVMGKVWKAQWSETQCHKINKDIWERDNAPLYRRTKLQISEVHASHLATGEEQFLSRLARKVPLIKGIVNMSERAHVTFLNQIRADAFDAMVDGMTGNEPTSAEMKAVANYVNITTGRGNMGNHESAANVLATALFSPRLMISRFQVITLSPLRTATPGRVRRAVAMEYAKFVVGASVVQALGAMAGADLEWDPRSSDFGKLKFGNTRIDLLGGLGQTLTFLSRVLSAETKSTKTGQIRALAGPDKPFGGDDVWSVGSKFARNKLAPGTTTLVNALSRQDQFGNNMDPRTLEGGWNLAKTSLPPIILGDVADVLKDQGLAKGIPILTLAALGAGTQVYDASKTKN